MALETLKGVTEINGVQIMQERPVALAKKLVYRYQNCTDANLFPNDFVFFVPKAAYDELSEDYDDIVEFQTAIINRLTEHMKSRGVMLAAEWADIANDEASKVIKK